MEERWETGQTQLIHFSMLNVPHTRLQAEEGKRLMKGTHV